MSPTHFNQIEPTFVALSADLPKGIVLNEQKILGFIRIKLKTSTLTTLSLSMTIEGLQIYFSPSIDILIMDTIRVQWNRVYYDFRQAKITTIDTSNNFWGKIVGRNLKKQLISISQKLFVNTPLKKRNYNPLADKNLMNTLQKLQQNTQKLEQDFASSSSDSFSLTYFKNIEVGLSCVSKQKIEIATTQGAIIVPELGEAAVSIKFEGSAKSLIHPSKRKIKEIQIYSENDVLLYSVDKKTKPEKALAIMQLIQILPKGKVSLLQWLPLGLIKKAENVENALRLLRVVLLLENIQPEALRQLMNAPNPTESKVVKDITKITIDDGLTEAFINRVKENCEPTEGINICALLNIE